MHFSKWLLTPLGAVVLLAGMASPVRAGLILDTVHSAYLYPDTSTVYLDGGNQVVNPTASFTFFTGATNNFVTVSDTQMQFSWDVGTSKSGATFNGIEVDIVGGSEPIIGVTIDPSSILPVGFDSSFVSFTGTTVYTNFAGLTVTSADNIVLDVSVAPEPSTFGLISLSIAAILLLRRLGRTA